MLTLATGVMKQALMFQELLAQCPLTRKHEIMTHKFLPILFDSFNKVCVYQYNTLDSAIVLDVCGMPCISHEPATQILKLESNLGFRP